MNRRSFIGLLGAGVAGLTGYVRAQPASPRIQFGVCAAIDKAAKLEGIGYDFIEGTVSGYLKPGLADEAFAPELSKLKGCELPIRSLNGFLPPKFRLTGPDVAHEPALAYAVAVCRRADEAGIPCIVLGSGAARKLPSGFDPAKGRSQFIAFCQALGDRIKDCKVTVVLEPLNRDETNLLNTVGEGVGYVNEINRPRIRLLADFHHMLREKESPDSIRKAGTRLCHCHIAELTGRSAPGTNGEDLGPFFKALRDIGYTGGVSCECGWPKTGLETAWKKALETMRKQAGV